MASLFPDVSGFFSWGPDSECSDAEDEFDAAERFDDGGLGGQLGAREMGPAAAAAFDDSHEQNPDADSDADDSGADNDGDEGSAPQEKRGEKPDPLKGSTPKGLPQATLDSVEYISFDVGTSSSDRRSGVIVNFGAAHRDEGGVIHCFDEKCGSLSTENHVAWSDNAIAVHGIKPADVEGCRNHVVVCKAFFDWCALRAPGGSVGAFVCHNGRSCGLDWLFHYTRRYNVKTPECMKYAFDTLDIVKGSASHPLKKGKYSGNLDTETLYALGGLYEAQFASRFDGGHGAGADAKAGLELFLEHCFFSRGSTRAAVCPRST